MNSRCGGFGGNGTPICRGLNKANVQDRLFKETESATASQMDDKLYAGPGEQ